MCTKTPAGWPDAWELALRGARLRQGEHPGAEQTLLGGGWGRAKSFNGKGQQGVWSAWGQTMNPR